MKFASYPTIFMKNYARFFVYIVLFGVIKRDKKN
jgi:hypothetical protein